MTRFAGLAVALAAVLSLAVTPALASKPNGGGGGTPTSATLTATPNPASAWGSVVSLAGCGYAAAPAVLRVVHPSGSTESYNVAVYSNGCLTATGFRTAEPGTYTVQILQTSGTKRGTTTSIKASTTVSVV
jgi:hypothetical protein